MFAFVVLSKIANWATSYLYRHLDVYMTGVGLFLKQYSEDDGLYSWQKKSAKTLED